jgi:acetyltransferase-like isoleucine patch superfamily enzyme
MRSVSWLGKQYVANWLYRRTRFVGALAVRLHRLMFPGFTIGKRPAVWGWFNLQIAEGGSIRMGDDMHLVSSPPRSWISLNTRCQFTAGPNGRIELADHVGLNGTTITAKKLVRIGRNTMVAPNVVIVDTDFHLPWPADLRWTSDSAPNDAAVIIGENVWIGMNTLVLKGVTIGDNTLIGAGSVVVGDIPANSIAAGNPARVIGTAPVVSS